jgi:phytoene synthase
MIGKTIQKKYSTSYYLATLLFPKKMKDATFALYGFVRTADELVDSAPSVEQATKDIDQWIHDWQEALRENNSTNEVIREMLAVVDTYKIPHELVDAFNNAMKADTTVSRYATYEELTQYMYGSAAVIGEMMSYIIGFTGDALPHARALGEAMQMTNFLRDIKEDFEKRGRIYIPEEDMQRFGVTTEMIAQAKRTPELAKLIAFECHRTQVLFRYAKVGIPLLDQDGQRAVIAATKIYEEVLVRVKAFDGDISIRAHVPKIKKLSIILSVLLAPSKTLRDIL